MSITASWLVLAVILLRLLLKKAPKALHCALWSLVAIRLICPFSLESSFSLVPQKEPITIQSFQTEEVTPSPRVEYEIVTYSTPAGEFSSSEPVMIVEHTGGPFSVLLPTYLCAIWLAGMGLMLLYALESYWHIRRKVFPSISIGNGVFICDHIPSPFILGMIHPRIYVPSSLDNDAANFVLAHERAHLKRKDHWWKPLGFTLLSVYWFNPVLWLAYVLLCRDIELACDEKVVKDMDIPAKKAYSTALLNCSLPRFRIMACPLAFGEVGVKARVKNVLHYKKPAFWFLLIAVVLCVIAAAGLLTDPTGIHISEIDDSRNYSDLLSYTEDMSLIIEGENYPVHDEASILEALDEITVRKFTLNRSRSEDRDKTNRIHLRGNTYLNFSWDCSHVWIDNGVKPTYTYRVNQPKQVREIFDTIYTENMKMVASEVTPTSLTLRCQPEGALAAQNAIEKNHWIEVWGGQYWIRQPSLRGTGNSTINVHINIDQDIHHLDWRADYGALPRGTYRIGVEYEFVDSGSRTFYAEFTIDSERTVTTWFDEDGAPLSLNIKKRSPLDYPGLEGVTLQYTEEDDGNKITAQTERGKEVLITGWPILNAYFMDLSGDGIPELCTSVCEGFGIIDTRIRVYDYVAGHLYELENRGVNDYELALRDDRLVVLESDHASGNTLNIGALALSYHTGGVPYLKMLELDNSFQANISTVQCVDIMNRKITCISKPEEITEILSLLHNLEKQVEPAAQEVITQAQTDELHICYLTINYDLGEKTLCFSRDFGLVWLSGEDQVYSVRNPAGIQEFVERMIDGVREKETTGQPFAIMDTPWDWTANVTSNAISFAEIYAQLETASYGNTSGYRTSNGIISSETLQEALKILNTVPRDAFSTKEYTTGSFTAEDNRFGNKRGVSLAFLDTVNALAVIIRYTENRTPEMIITDEISQYRNHYAEDLQATPVWTVKDEHLEAYMQSLLEDPPVITYTVGAEYNWQEPVYLTRDDFSHKLYLIEGWEYETVEQWNYSGIRTRPEGIEEGWILFSYWPKGYNPKETDRHIDEFQQGNNTDVVSWPASVKQENSFSTYGAIWSYRKTTMDIGDYAVINDGADDWFLEYEDQIDDMYTINQYIPDQEGY